MPDKKLTDNEIVKALELCGDVNASCEKCPFLKEAFCRFSLARNVLAYIKRLQAEKEKLQKNILKYEDIFVEQQAEIKEWKRVVETWQELHEKDKAENERLSAEICGQKEANLFLINDKEKAINGAIKKFCDILKKRINNEPLVFFEQRHIVYDEIDNLVKEMVGEDK